MKNDSSPRPASPRHLGGRIWKICIGLVLIAAGSIFVSYLWKNYLRASEMDEWVEVPCRIETLTVDDSQLNQHGMPKYALEVSYRYQFKGHDYLGDHVKRGSIEVNDPLKLKSKIASYAVGTEAVCYLDPDAPERVVLIKDSKAALYSLWFPCLFVVGGAGMILSALFRKRA